MYAEKLLLLLPLLLSLCGALSLWLLPGVGEKNAGKPALVFAFAVSVSVLALLLDQPGTRWELFTVAEGLPIALRLDGLGSVFLALIAFLWPLATLYADEYMEGEENLKRFFGFYLLSFGVTAGVALSANLITMYLFYELLTLSTVPLVAHSGDRRSMAAARKYILYSIGGAALSFVGIVILYTRTGCTDFVYGGVGEGGGSELLLAYILTFAGFGVKAAIFPFHGWLPAASVAPTPVTALLHAVAVVKSGVFACIRSAFYAFGPALLLGTWAQQTVLALSAFTIVYGSAMAYKEQHWKRRLAYSTVSNLSYILFGMGLLTAEGLIAGLSHMLFHGVMKITLFFCAGTVLCRTGREYVPECEGLGRKMPLTFAVYTLASLALTGAPLLPGFVSKLNLINAAAECGGAFAMGGIVALLLSALLTAAYLLPMSFRAFLPREGTELSFTERDRDPSWRMLLPFVLLCLTLLALGMNATPVMNALTALLKEAGI